MVTKLNMSKKIYYVIIDTCKFPEDGIAIYSQLLANFISKKYKNIKPIIFKNEFAQNADQFRKAVFQFVTNNFRPDEIIIESPETGASTLLLQKRWNIHVRFHCTRYVIDKYTGVSPDLLFFKNDIDGINKASFISSPSYSIIDELSIYLKVKYPIFVYRNPVDPYLNNVTLAKTKIYDSLFMARNDPIKGSDLLPDILKCLPAEFHVAIIGRNMNKLILDKNIKCKMTRLDLVTGMKRFDYLKNAISTMILSRYENCSMLAIEAITNGSKVIGWQRGGTQEFIHSNLSKFFPFGDTDSFAKAIIETSEDYKKKSYPSADCFDENIQKIKSDFKFGFEKMIAFFMNIESLSTKTVKIISNLF